MEHTKLIRYKLFAILSTAICGYTVAASLNVSFVNASPSVAHLDYSSSEFTISPTLTDGNFPFYSTTTLSASNANIYGMNVQAAQYSAETLLGTLPKCYYSFTYNGSTWTAVPSSDTTSTYCTVTGSGSNFVISLAWPAVAAVDYSAVTGNAFTIINGFMSKQTNNAHYMVANQVPLSEAQLNNYITATQTNSSNGWTLQFAYDSIRLPLWLGGDYQTNTTSVNHTSEYNYLKGLTDYLGGSDGQKHTCVNSSGNVSVSTSGFWAQTVSGVSGATVGSAVSTDCGSTPALEGPLAVAAQSMSGTTSTAATLFSDLIKTLDSYSISAHTFSAFASTAPTINQSNYSSTSSPYFNAALDLISEAFLIGKGSFDISSANNGSTDSSSYLNYEHFKSNYSTWLSSGFVTAYMASDNQGNKVDALRVIYSTYNAITYQPSSAVAGASGNSPTVSEGMAYGLLIAYAANDQATFNKFLWYILSEAHIYGCARISSPDTPSVCAVKSEYLMPWMVDESGVPFKYAVAGNNYTNGSATDADIQMVWPLQLAQKRVNSGGWTNTLFNGLTYGEVAHAMAGEINRYEINYNVNYYGAMLSQGSGVIFSPGSQWGTPTDPTSSGSNGSTSGTNLIYAGYITPQAFAELQTAQTSSVASAKSHSSAKTKAKQAHK